MRLLTLLFIALIILIQYPLWFGREGWMNVFDLQKKYQAQRAVNLELDRENDALRAEVNDLKRGTDAIEERARDELGMIKKDEVFFEVITPKETK